MKRSNLPFIPMIFGLILGGSVTAQVPCEDLEVTVVWDCLGDGAGWAAIDNITGAVDPVTIEWSTGQNVQFITSLTNGTHSVTITDGVGCMVQEFFTIDCGGMDCELDFDYDYGCEDEGEGWANVSNITGATGDVTVYWSTGATDVMMINGLVSGEYWVYILDAAGCWDKYYFTISCPPEGCELDFDYDYGCEEEGEGWANVSNITGATGDVTVYWSTGATDVMMISGLVSGDYWVYIVDAAGCWDKYYFTIDCPPEDCELDFDYDYGCEAEGEGWANVSNITGATGDVTVSWSTGATDVMMITGLDEGDYWVYIVDASGCWDKYYFTIDCPDAMPCQLRTQTQGGWGSPGNGNNPGVYRDMHFDDAFPDGLTIGCASGNTLTLTSAEAVQDFLPSGSTPSMLPDGDMVDPGNYNNVLAGQLVALTLSVGFDAYDPDFGMSASLLANAVLNTGMFSGWTVQELLDEANAFIGGCESEYSASQVNEALSMVNENFVDGDTNNGDLDCMGMEGRMLLQDGSLQMKTYPIPAVDVLNVSFETEETGTYILDLMDMSGRTLLYHVTGTLDAGVTGNAVLSVVDLTSGSYLLMIKRDGITLNTQRIIVSR